MSQELLMRALLVVGVALCVLYQFGYSDRFPYFGKNEWSKRPFYREIYFILMRRVERYSNGAPISPESKARLESTVDMVIAAFAQDHDRVQVNLPNFECGLVVVDIRYEITRDEVLNIELNTSD